MKKIVFIVVLVLCISIAVPVLAAPGTEKKPAAMKIQKIAPKVDPSVYAKFNESRTARVIIERGGKFTNATLTKSQVDTLAQSDVKIWNDGVKYPLLDVSVPMIGASSVWTNYTGAGVKVCVLDTGINNNAALAGRVVAAKDFTGDGTTDDLYGHGTHVAGIIASNDAAYKGVAPNAQLLNAKVMNRFGQGQDSWIMSGIDWCIAQGAQVLSLSLGGPDSAGDGSDPLSQYLDYASQYAVVVVSAGNSGPVSTDHSCRSPYDPTGSTYSICSPGLSHRAITVGSVGTGKGATPRDSLSAFSSRGPTADYRIKPDVVAPGDPITSLGASGGFVTMAGTSMASPHVSGLAALILQAKPLSGDEIKALIMNSASGTTKNYNYGSGRIDAVRAMAEINDVATFTARSNYSIHNVYVPANTSELRVTLYWPESASLHNDLDLYLRDPQGTVRALSESQYNTDEIAFVANPRPGYWKIEMNPFDVRGAQSYVIAASAPVSQQMYSVFANASAFYQSNATIAIDWLSNVTVVFYANGTSFANDSGNHAEAYAIAGVIATGNYSVTSASPITQFYPAVNITIASPGNGNYTGNVTINFTASSNLLLPVSCIVTVDNATVNSMEISLPDGQHTLNITCNDSVSTASEARVFNTNSSAPVVAFTTESGAVQRNYSYIGANITNGMILSCALEWDGVNESVPIVNDSCSINKTAGDGVHSYKIYVSDNYGTIAANGTLVFDGDPPFAIAGTNYTNDGNISISYSEMNLLAAYFSFNGTNTTLNCTSGINQTCSYAVNISSYAEGDQVNYSFTLGDYFVNSTFVGAAIIDRVPPSIAIHSPENTTYNRAEISVGYDSDGMCYFIFNNNAMQPVASITAQNGANELAIICTDVTGNSANATVDFFFAPPRQAQAAPPPPDGGSVTVPSPPVPPPSRPEANASNTTNSTAAPAANDSAIVANSTAVVNSTNQIVLPVENTNQTAQVPAASPASPATGFAAAAEQELAIIMAIIIAAAGAFALFWNRR